MSSQSFVGGQPPNGATSISLHGSIHDVIAKRVFQIVYIIVVEEEFRVLSTGHFQHRQHESLVARRTPEIAIAIAKIGGVNGPIQKCLPGLQMRCDSALLANIVPG